MNEEQIKTLIEIITQTEKEYDMFPSDYLDTDELKEIETIEDLDYYLTEELNEDRQITNAEIIYYDNAMEFLMKNDNGLHECMEIASEYGYEVSQLNSELLASLLATKYNEENYNTMMLEVIEQMKEYF